MVRQAWWADAVSVQLSECIFFDVANIYSPGTPVYWTFFAEPVRGSLIAPTQKG